MSADRINQLADVVIRDIAELPDYTSPDEWPQALMATPEELRAIIIQHLSASQVCTPVGWISVEDSRRPQPRKPILVAVEWIKRGEDDDGRPFEQTGIDVTEGEWVGPSEHGEGYFASFQGEHGDSSGVTHWMELPAAPTAAQPAQAAPSKPVGALQPAAQPQAVEDADKVDAERCCGWPGDGCPCQVAHESRFATCTVSRASLQMVLQFVDRSQLGIDEDIAECERAIDAARTAAAGGKEGERASDIIRAEPWLKSAEVRERLGGDE